MYDPKQNLNIFSRNMYIFLKYCGLQREKDIRKEKQIWQLGFGNINII